MITPTELRQQLRALGYAPLPLFGKAPPTYSKNNKRRGLNGWAGAARCQRGRTAQHPMPTLDLDILNEEAVRAAEDFVRARYEERGGRILVRIGLPPKRAIPFRTEEPFKKIVVNLTRPTSGENHLRHLVCIILRPRHPSGLVRGPRPLELIRAVYTQAGERASPRPKRCQ